MMTVQGEVIQWGQQRPGLGADIYLSQGSAGHLTQSTPRSLGLEENTGIIFSVSERNSKLSTLSRTVWRVGRAQHREEGDFPLQSKREGASA